MSTVPTADDRRAANHAWLALQLERFRLRLRAHVRLLRAGWARDGADGGTTAGAAITDAEADRLLSGGPAAAERELRASDPELAATARAVHEVETALAERARRAPWLPALVLGERFELEPLERDVLLLALAPELDWSFARLFAYAHDDARRAHLTPHLALALLLDDERARVEALAHFAPLAPLRHRRLVHLDAAAPGGTLTARPLRVDERVAEYLRGINRPDERVADLLRPLPQLAPAPAHARLAAAVARTLGGRRRAAVNVVGDVAGGAEDLARAVAAALGLRPYAVDLRRLALHAGAERLDVLHTLERDVVLLDAVLHVEADAAGDAPEGRALVAELTERFAGPLLLVSRERWRSSRDFLALSVPPLPAAAQRELWSAALGGVAADGDGAGDVVVDGLVQQFALAPRDVARAVASAARHARLRADGAPASVTAEDLWDACRAETAWELEGLAHRIEPRRRWDDIVLPPDVAAQLREIAAQVAHRAQVYERWGFGARLSRGSGITALFAGPSGTGKTLAAEILATELRLELIVVDLAGVVSKYIGETEKNLRRVFDAAERSGAILFFDEADALFGKRTDVKDSHDRYANIEVNYLLQRMEEYRGLAILASNRKTALDRAFLRRLRFLVDFPFPDLDGRRRIWRRVVPPEAETVGLDYDALARLEVPGGNIRNIALNAAFLAAGEGTPIGMPHVMRAARREYVKIDRPPGAAEFGAWAGGGGP